MNGQDFKSQWIAQARAAQQNGSTATLLPEEMSSWEPLDSVTAWDGVVSTPGPTYLPRSDERRLLYAGKTHLIFGEPEACKGWFAMVAVLEVLRRGEHAFYGDFEDDHDTALARLRTLGATKADVSRFHYVCPDAALDAQGEAAIERMLDLKPALAVFDGVTNGMELEGGSIESNTDAAKWFRRLPTRFRKAGAAVIVIDHVTKNPQSRGRYSIGAQNKLGSADVGLAFEVVHPFGIGLTGEVKIVVKKDRPAHLRQAARAKVLAVMRLASESNGDRVTVTLDPPIEADVVKPPSASNVRALMEAFSRVLEAEGPVETKRAMLGTVSGNTDRKKAALDRLAKNDYIEVRTEGRKQIFTSIRPFRAQIEEASDEPDV